MTKINYFSPDKHKYSQIITTIANSPERLWLVGRLPAERRPTVAIVGTRKPTAYGREMTYRFSFELARRGVVIVSGLALGIDSIAHQAALDAGGTTLAILPGSIDRVYPRTHQRLANQIVTSGGGLISESGPGVAMHRGSFIARNRIVTGLSDGLLITEAAAHSGTLSTASFALEQGRVVMVLPGNITSPLSAGCNNLLKSGATPITELDDILHELGWTEVGTQKALPFASNPEEGLILELLAAGERDGEALHRRSNLDAASFSQTITMLELSGKIRALGANQWGIQ